MACDFLYNTNTIETCIAFLSKLQINGFEDGSSIQNHTVLLIEIICYISIKWLHPDEC